MYYYVDHTSRFPHNTGIQRCVRMIARALLGAGVPLRPVVWDREHCDLIMATPDALDHLARWSGPNPSSWTCEEGGDQWLLIVELIRGPHQPTPAQLRQAAVKRGLRLAWVFHDAIPVRLAHLYGPAAAAVAASHRLYMAGLAEADLVLANSHTSARHLRSFLEQESLASQHVRSLPLALEFPGVPRAQPRPTHHAAARPHRLLAVGSLEKRKNHLGLMKAVVWLAAQDRFEAELVLVGWSNDPAVVALIQRTQSLGLPLRWEDAANDRRLADLYHWCDATVVASLEEGFGLPVAESLWHGKPCLTTAHGALAELVVGGGCFPFPGPAWPQLAAGLHRWLSEPHLREQLAREVQQRPLRSWRDYAVELLDQLNSHLKLAHPC